MVDYLSIGLTHVLLILAAWRLISRLDLDRDDVAPGTTVKMEREALRNRPAAGLAGTGPKGNAHHV